MPTAIVLACRDKEGTTAACACVESRPDLPRLWLCPWRRVPTEANAGQGIDLYNTRNVSHLTTAGLGDDAIALSDVGDQGIYIPRSGGRADTCIIWYTARLCLTLTKRHTTAAVCVLQANLRVHSLGPSMRLAFPHSVHFPHLYSRLVFVTGS